MGHSVRAVLDRHGDTIRSETLAVDLRLAPAEAWPQIAGGLPSAQFELDGHEV